MRTTFLMDVDAEQKTCDILGHLRRRDGTLSDVVIAIDTKAQADCISRRRVDADRLLTDTTRRRRIVGATAGMSAMSDGSASFDVVTSSGETRLDAIVVDGLTADVIIGAPTLKRLGATIVASPTGSDISWPTPVATVHVAKETQYRFNSRADKMLSRINFDDVSAVLGQPVSDNFRRVFREQCERLEQAHLLIGSESPGHKYPDPLRGATHTIRLKPDADISRIYARWRHRRPDEFAMLREHTRDLEEAGILERIPFGVQPYVNNPILVVPKRNEKGEITGGRVVHDARLLNNETLLQRTAMPHVSTVTQIASRGGGRSLRSKIDLANFYMQFELEPDCRWADGDAGVAQHLRHRQSYATGPA
jgi:hypothetical protein